MSRDITILLKGKIDLELLKSKINSDSIIYALDNDAHKILYQNSIQHEIADEKLKEADLNLIFDKAVSLYSWYDHIPDNFEFEINGVNFFSVLDTMELHSFLVNFLYDFVIIKRIIEENSPKKIIVSDSLRNVILPLLRDCDSSYEILKSKKMENMVYGSIEIKFNIGKIPVSISLSHNNYLKLKNFVEGVVCKFYNLWPDRNTSKRSTLFLEMNPTEYEFLIDELTSDGIQILFLNNRRPATWSKKSIEILHHHNCKVLSLHRLLSRNEKKEINTTASQIRQKIILLKNNKKMEKIFTYDDVSFWSGINEELFSTFENRAYWYVLLLIGAKKTLDDFNVNQILSVNVVGATEKAILASNRNIIPSLMLEHAFANYLPEISRYDILSMYSLFKDRIVVWGEIQKSYLINQHGVTEDRIIVAGSPRHDAFFIKKPKIKNKDKVVLITPRPIIDTALHKKIDLYKKYEVLLKNILQYFEKNNDIKVIIKIHPGLDFHNVEIKKIIQQYNSDIPIYQSSHIRELIEISHAHINISPEGFDLSTVILESLILSVPVMNITLDEKIYDFEINKMNAIMNAFPDSPLEKRLEELIFDNDIRKLLIQNGQRFLQKYLINMGNASKYLARELLTLQSK